MKRGKTNGRGQKTDQEEDNGIRRGRRGRRMEEVRKKTDRSGGRPRDKMRKKGTNGRG